MGKVIDSDLPGCYVTSVVNISMNCRAFNFKVKQSNKSSYMGG